MWGAVTRTHIETYSTHLKRESLSVIRAGCVVTNDLGTTYKGSFVQWFWFVLREGAVAAAAADGLAP